MQGSKARHSRLLINEQTMNFKWKRLLFRLIGLEFLSKEVSKYMHSITEELALKFKKLMLQSMLWLLMILLFNLALFFSLLALSLYLNELFCSAYQGFFVVAGGCIALMLVLLGIVKFFWANKEV